MDWNLFKVFLAIARSGSLSAAAKALKVNHSTVFRRLNTLEQAIGGRLFERINHHYTLTQMGRETLELAQSIEDSFATIERHIVGKDFQPQGVVKITAPYNIAYRYLPSYILDFNQHYPDIHIEVLVSNDAINMNDRQADIAVRATSSPPEHLVGRHVRTIGWSVVGSKAYQEKYGYPKSKETLKAHQCIGASGHMSGLAAFLWLEKHFPHTIVARSNELVTMSYLAESGLGLAVLPDDQLRPGIEKLFEIEAAGKSDLWLLTHPDLRHVERIKLVMHHLASAFTKESAF